MRAKAHIKILAAILLTIAVVANACQQDKKGVASLRDEIDRQTDQPSPTVGKVEPEKTTESISPAKQVTESDRERRKREALERIRKGYDTESMSLSARRAPDPLEQAAIESASRSHPNSEPQTRDFSKDPLNLCQNGIIEACHRFGWLQEQSGNRAGAARFYRLACERGLLKSCNNLGWQAEQAGQLSVALDYYSRACLAHHPGSCRNLRRATEKAKILR